MLNSSLLIRKIFMQLIFPPGGIILALLVIIIFLIFNKKKLASIVSFLLIAFLLFLSSWWGEYFLVKPLEDDYPFLQKETLETISLTNPLIVVLGGAVVEKSLSGKTEIGNTTLSRLYGAYQIYQEITCPIWVSGGNVPGYSADTPASKIMLEILISLGIPADDIFIEDQSRTTMENALFALEEIKKQGYQEIILVTSATHMHRSVHSFENEEIKIIPAPVDYAFENTTPKILNILPNRYSWNNNLNALHEWIGLLYYKIIY